METILTEYINIQHTKKTYISELHIPDGNLKPETNAIGRTKKKLTIPRNNC